MNFRAETTVQHARTTAAMPRRLGAWAAACLACAPLVGFGADGQSAGQRPVQVRVKDPAVRPAGGVQCASCGGRGCSHGHGSHHGHHAGCRDGVCIPSCPVRPHQFGFYGTQWRVWPGSNVVPVSAGREVGPVAPPRSAVPGPAEESLSSPEDAATSPDAADGRLDALPPAAGPLAPRVDPQPPEPQVPPKPPIDPLPRPTPEPAPEMPAEPKPDPLPESKSETDPKPAVEPKPEPATEPKVTPEPKPLPSEPAPKPIPDTKPRPEDENLFEAVSGAGAEWRAIRRFPVGPQADLPQAVGRVEPATHLEQPPEQPDLKRVPRVPFDPAAETRRLRSGR